jgi:hypothetical protein
MKLPVSVSVVDMNMEVTRERGRGGTQWRRYMYGGVEAGYGQGVEQAREPSCMQYSCCVAVLGFWVT